jgi:ribonuclease HI
MPPKPPNSFTLFCDGASRGNPGPGAYGFVLLEGENIISQEGQVLGIVTNNVAEYKGLIAGLERCLSLKVSEITVKSDSELLVRQMNGAYQVKAAPLVELFNQAQALVQKFKKAEILHVRREENTLADALCNQALDRNQPIS